MSHFTVIVAAHDEHDLERKLLPFEEQTENRDFLEFVDMTNLVIDEYKNRDIEQAKIAPGDDWEFRHARRFGGLPDDMIEIRTVKMNEVYATEGEFASDWHGYDWHSDREAYGYYTNQNAKWDWYSIGGRWTGMLHLKPEQKLLIRGNTEVAGLNKNEIDVLVGLYRNNMAKFKKNGLALLWKI